MVPPNRGRGRSQSYGRGGGSSNRLPPNEITVPLLGDWTTVSHNRSKPYSTSQKTEEASSSKSSGKIISYKEAATNDSPQEQVSEYYENPFTEDIFHIEDEDIDLFNNDGWAVKTRYLESRGYPGLFGKSRPHLEILLTVTESVIFTHNFHNNNPENYINFSKCHINKVLTPKEWGLNPNGERAIKIAENRHVYFNYWDYVQAFTLAFYYQNPKNKHSWFFSINPEIIKRPIPNWFYEWWMKFGPSIEILPKELFDLYNQWSSNSPLILKIKPDNLYTGQCPMLFFSKFQIPWIWRWSLIVTRNKFNIPILQRIFFYKWWTKMSQEDIQALAKCIHTAIKTEQASENKESSSTQNPMVQMKNYFQRKYPTETETEIMVRVMDHMKQQFFTTFPSQASREDVMSTSSQGSADILAGESQQLEEPTPGDIWDALTHTIGKGKGIQ